jgi:ActR/RegA family two-component response regulator
MEFCEILIVEDDEHALESWRRDIHDFNRASGKPFKYQPLYAKTLGEALKVLSRTRIDCAVVDLRLPREPDDKTEEATGNEVLAQLLVEVGVPAVVYSGHPAEASEVVRQSNIKVLQKQGNGGAEILEGFAQQAGLIEAMEKVRRTIAKETARLFNGSIWSRWQATWHSSDQDVTAGVIARQTASHIADSMSLPPGFYHPDEFFIVPPLHAARLDTGDLFSIGEETYVVMTPRCNMANAMPQNLLLCLLRPVNHWAEIRDLLRGSQKNKDSAAKKMKTLATQAHATSSHFLPPCGGLGPWLVDFQEVRTIPSADATALLSTRIASIAPHFVPNLVQRYASYHGRIGQPDIDTKILEGICLTT